MERSSRLSQSTILTRLNMNPEELKHTLLAHARGDMEKHLANVKIYLNSPVGIGEHSDVMKAIEEELAKVAYYRDIVNVLKDLL